MINGGIILRNNRRRNLFTTRTLEHASLFLKKDATIRSVAKLAKSSRSTVFADLTERLQWIDYDLYLVVKEKLKYNFSIKHLNGGQATKDAWLGIKKGE
jgi:putative DeoR family transcriptional regulator (stage III sporulation protein D)